MSLNRYIPNPSDRMGMTWALLSVKDAVVLEYGPAGTTHFSIGTLSALGLDAENRLFTTHLGENDVIMGDVGRLEAAILEIDENIAPKYIFVLSSAVVSIIGTDITGVCHYMQEQTKAKLVPVDTGGFLGDYSVGLRNAWRKLIDTFCAPLTEADKESADDEGTGRPQESLQYNILGASPYRYRIGSDVEEMKRLLSEAFGMNCNVILGMETSSEELADMGKAAVNLVISAEALPAAEKLKELYGTPFIYGAPYGYAGTREWLTWVAEVTGRSISSVLLAELKKKMAGMSLYRMYAEMYARGTKVPKAAIAGEYDVVYGIGTAMKEACLPIACRICNHAKAGVERACEVNPLGEGEEVWYPATEKERIQRLKELTYTLLLGDDVSIHCLGEKCYGVTVSQPLVNHLQRATHLPFMGIRGMDYLMEEVDRFYGML